MKKKTKNERVEDYLAEEKKLLDKYCLEKIPTLVFPRHIGRNVPLLARWATRIINSYGAEIYNHFIQK